LYKFTNKSNVLPSPVSYYYGIRNNKVIKIKKDTDQESEGTQTRKIQELSEELKLKKDFLFESLEKMKSEYNKITCLKISNANTEVIKSVAETVQIINKNTKEQFQRVDEKFTFSCAVMLFNLEGIDLDGIIANPIKKTLKNYVEKYKIN